MTLPRQVLKGTTYFVTRRTFQRQYLLTPGRILNQIFEYCLARQAELRGIELHVYCVMSNHYHLLLTDPEARLPEFMQHLDGVLARAVNALRGRRGYVWDARRYHAEPVGTAEDAVQCAAYALANPVRAGLVRRARDWPGPWSRPHDFGSSWRVERPAFFFGGARPGEEAPRMTLTAPPGFESVREFRERVQVELRRRELEVEQSGCAVVGARRVLEQDPLGFPSSEEPLRQVVPKVAARDPEVKAALIGRLKAFVAGYLEAMGQWRSRCRSVIFPEGTYLMRVLHGVTCAGAG